MLSFVVVFILLIYKVIFLVCGVGVKNKIWINNLYGTLLWLIFF
jgi:hypothetical protein